MASGTKVRKKGNGIVLFVPFRSGFSNHFHYGVLNFHAFYFRDLVKQKFSGLYLECIRAHAHEVDKSSVVLEATASFTPSFT